MKKLLTILLVCFAAMAKAQSYNPSVGTTSNKPYSPAQAVPTDARSMFFDATNFIWRPYQNTTEALTYLGLPKYRTGNFLIIIDSGGVLGANGVYTGGINQLWMFKDGVADANLVQLNIGASSVAGSGTVTNFSANPVPGLVWSVLNPTTTPSLTPAFTFGGDVSGPNPANISVNQFNGLPPAYYLNYQNLSNTPTIPSQFAPVAGANISITGTYPNLTFASTGGGVGTAGYGIKFTGGGAIVNIDSLNYRKVDSLYNPNDSTLVMVLNGVSRSLILRGGVKGGGAGTGSVTSVSVVTANGVSGTVANPASTPAITLTLGNITPTSVNGLTLASLATGFTISGGTTSKTLTVPNNASVSGTNTGDISLAGENYLSLSGQVLTANPINLSGTNVTGVLKASAFPALTGDVTTSAGSVATTISTNVVTNAKLAQMAALTIKGNNTGATANALDLTPAQVNVMLPVFTTTLKGLVPAPGAMSGLFLRDDGTWAAAGGGGSGNTNSNVGVGWRLAIPNTNNIKTLLTGVGVTIDSSVANTLRFAVDTTVIQAKGFDTIYAVKAGNGLNPIFVSQDTIYHKGLNAGANVTFTQNPDSSITITAAAPGTGGVTIVGPIDQVGSNLNGAIISGNQLYMQSASASVPGLVNTAAQTIAGVKSFSAAPNFLTLTSPGGVFYGNSSGTLLQTNSGTINQVLIGGPAPFFGAVNLASMVSGILPIGNGGTGTATPGIVAGAGIAVSGSWPNQTITSTGGGGGVSSVAFSGGTTGLFANGGPITTSGTFTLGGTLIPANGGTGKTSYTPYALIAGGSTATGTLQQISGVGTLGQALISNGAGQLPSWQSISATNSFYRTQQLSDSSYALLRPDGTADTIKVFTGGGGSGSDPRAIIGFNQLNGYSFVGYRANGTADTVQFNLSSGGTSNPILLTTNGTSGPATYDGTTLNIPQYTGGGSGVSQGLQDVITTNPNISTFKQINLTTGGLQIHASAGQVFTIVNDDLVTTPNQIQGRLASNTLEHATKIINAGTYTITLAYDDYSINASSGNVIINISPFLYGAWGRLSFMRADNSANTVTIRVTDGAGNSGVIGAPGATGASYTGLSAAGKNVELKCAGYACYITSSN